MRYFHHLHGVRKICDSMVERKFVVIGRRAETKPVRPASDASEEDKDAYRLAFRRHALKQSEGYFADSIIDWCADQAQAEEVESAHREPDWLDVRIEPVAGVIR